MPINEEATITLSLNAQYTELTIDEVILALRSIDHVFKVDLISMSM